MIDVKEELKWEIRKAYLILPLDISKDCYIFDMKTASFSVQKPITVDMGLSENIKFLSIYFQNYNRICFPIMYTNKFILYDKQR